MFWLNLKISWSSNSQRSHDVALYGEVEQSAGYVYPESSRGKNRAFVTTFGNEWIQHNSGGLMIIYFIAS